MAAAAGDAALPALAAVALADPPAAAGGQPAPRGRSQDPGGGVSRRVRGKSPAVAALSAEAQAAANAALVGAATADVDEDEPRLQASVKRKNIHWTHVRTYNPAYVQPEQVTREETWKHLEKVYAEAYPVAGSPTKSHLAFGLVCQERHLTSPVTFQRDLHRHVPTVATEQLYWNKIASLSLAKYNWPLNAVAHDSYHTMFSYVRSATAKKPLHELDATPFFSPLHPKGDELADFLKKSEASHKKNEQRKGMGRGGAGDKTKRERLPSLFELIQEHNIRTPQQLQARACTDAAEGRTALAEYCTKNGGKLQEIIANALGVMEAPAKISEAPLTLMQKLAAVAANGQCSCGGCWAEGAKAILDANRIDPAVFCGAVRYALEMGARRGVNIACVGERGCGKSTLLESLELIFSCFPKPQAGSTFALANLVDCDVILWQDYFHNERTVQFTDLLSLFVGETIGVRHVGKNASFKNKAPIFYSGLMPMRCGLSDRTIAEKLNGMMDDRFTIFSFTTEIPREHRRPDWPKCGTCAAAFFLGSHVAPAPPIAPPGGPIAQSWGLSTGASSSSSSSGSAGAIADCLRQLAVLYAEGSIDDVEYRAAKRRTLGIV